MICTERAATSIATSARWVNARWPPAYRWSRGSRGSSSSTPSDRSVRWVERSDTHHRPIDAAQDGLRNSAPHPTHARPPRSPASPIPHYSALADWTVHTVDTLPRLADDAIVAPFMNHSAVLPLVSRQKMSLLPSPL